METATDTTQTEVSTSTDNNSTDTNQSQDTTQTQTNTFDASKIDPKVKEHFEKEYSTKYADYEDSKKAANELRLMRSDPSFQKWITDRNRPEPPKPFEIDDERFTQALTDRNKFTQLVQEAAKHLIENDVRPKLAQTEQKFALEAKTNELNATIQKYPDFKELDKRGFIAPIIEKYGPGLSFEDAYWIARKNVHAEDIAKKARGQVDARKGANVEKPNNAPSARRNVVKVADRLEAMERAAEDFRAGREIGEYDYD